ncbi:MAG TPA: hypothetical protein VMU39_10815 [Solirubrobacteraceae bacterium]|nr:hypothetical protein [Solirubrobacteraceae bacterium]
MRREVVHRQQRRPLDPGCEIVVAFAESLGGDEVDLVFGEGREAWLDFEHRHRADCERCGLYGVQYESPLGFTVWTARPAVAAWRLNRSSSRDRSYSKRSRDAGSL